MSRNVVPRFQENCGWSRDESRERTRILIGWNASFRDVTDVLILGYSGLVKAKATEHDMVTCHVVRFYSYGQYIPALACMFWHKRANSFQFLTTTDDFVGGWAKTSEVKSHKSSNTPLSVGSALNSDSNGPGSSPGRSHCVLFLGKNFHSQCLYPPRSLPRSTNGYWRI